VKKSLKILNNILEDKSKILFKSNKNYKVVSIATTSNVNNPELYFASYRESDNSITLTIILNSSIYIKQIISYFDSRIDYFLLDTESKSSIRNFLQQCEKHIKSTGILYYKPNDITVECVKNYFLFNKIKNKNILICGVGNIGTKLALGLSEISNNIYLKSSDQKKSKKIAETIKLIAKTDRVIEVLGNKNLKIDYIIGTSAGVPVITKKEIKLLSSKGVILDVGNGSVDKSILNKTINNGVKIYCTNIIEEYKVFIEFLLSQENQDLIEDRSVIDGYSFIKVGMVGKKNDILVDNPKKIGKIYGICNGSGDLLYGKNIDKRLKKINKVIDDEKNK